ncbi:MAG TPA: FAD-linked oxidase C-terminal domain-containing protein, partial [Phycisphaerales bacterium]|nr:FAD-linked oxidase C-terminal domain-containing protein [Phycisphaerales bacterium]
KSEIAFAWKLRKAGEPLLHGLPGERKPLTFIEDTAVAPERLQVFVREFRDIVARHGTKAAYYAHASVGCLHIRPLISLRNPDDVIAMRRIAEDVTDLVIKYKGALSGEHGDGRVRGMFLERYFGKEICDGFRRIKQIFDPKGLLNPGMLVAPVDLAQHLRIKPQDDEIRVPEIKTYFQYEKEHGFSGAVEMCNGAGICRRTTGGTMCPSYRALLDERHAPRGRGNALRLAITGQIGKKGKAAWGDEDTLQTLDLCLSCKACKTECPSNVDIAKLKAEFVAQSYERKGRTPFTAKVFGNIRALNRMGAALPWLSNALNRTFPAKYLASKILGIDSRRSLPKFHKSLFSWRAGRPIQNADGPVVILFPDCFTTYNEPAIGRAAILSLEALGYRVVLPDVGCCGRSMISLGMLDRAISTCRSTASNLAESIRKEKPVAIVACEPSCLSAIKDDWLDLRLDVDRKILQDLAAKSSLIEQFIEQQWGNHPKNPVPSSKSSKHKLVLHGHCHQKALWGAESSAALLRRIAGENLTVLDSGCCGMAGSFGYMKSKYDLSMAIGEQSLFGDLRNMPDAIVAAPGTSCRQQINDGTQRTALHPIEIFAEWLGLATR